MIDSDVIWVSDGSSLGAVKIYIGWRYTNSGMVRREDNCVSVLYPGSTFHYDLARDMDWLDTVIAFVGSKAQQTRY